MRNHMVYLTKMKCAKTELHSLTIIAFDLEVCFLVNWFDLRYVFREFEKFNLSL